MLLLVDHHVPHPYETRRYVLLKGECEVVCMAFAAVEVWHHSVGTSALCVGKKLAPHFDLFNSPEKSPS